MGSEVDVHEEGPSDVGRPMLQDAPPVAIAQPASSKKPKEVTEGQFYAPDSGEPLGEKIVLVPMARFDTRSYFPGEKDPNRVPDSKVPRCSSNDSIYPITQESPPVRGADGSETIVDNCVQCPYSHWRTNKADKSRLPPLCSLSINLFAVVYRELQERDESGNARWDARVARLRFQRTAFKHAETLMKSFDAQFPKKPMFETAVEVSIAGPFGTDKGRKWYEPRFRVIGRTGEFFDRKKLGSWKDVGAPQFRDLTSQWPALYEKIKTRVAMGDDEDAEFSIPF